MSSCNVTFGTGFAALGKASIRSGTDDAIQLSPGTSIENSSDTTLSLTHISPDDLADLRNLQPDPPNTQAILNVRGHLSASLTNAELDLTGANNDMTHPDSISGSSGAGTLLASGNDPRCCSARWRRARLAAACARR